MIAEPWFVGCMFFYALDNLQLVLSFVLFFMCFDLGFHKENLCIYGREKLLGFFISCLMRRGVFNINLSSTWLYEQQQQNNKYFPRQKRREYRKHKIIGHNIAQANVFPHICGHIGKPIK